MKLFKILPEVQALRQSIVQTRRQLHMYPELSLKEYNTTKFIDQFLNECGLKVHKVDSPTGTVGLLSGEAGPGPCILLRSDIDALPIQDCKNTEYKSRNQKVSHACAHDGHISCLLYAAKILSEQKNKLKGNIKFCFEPAEEVGKGAKIMIENPVYPVLKSDPKVDFSFGLHLWTQFETGAASVKKGTCSSILNSFKIRVQGKSAHGSQPELGIDAIIIMNQLINNLQTIISRNVNPNEFAVLSIGTIQGGSAPNVIAGYCEIQGTTRAFDQRTNDLILQRIQKICQGVQQSFECPKVEFIIDHNIPSISNTEEEAKICLLALKDILQSENIYHNYQMNGSEDFSFYLQQVPGAYAYIGAAPNYSVQDGVCKMSHHESDFDINEDSLLIATSYWVQLARKYLSQK